MQLVDNVIKYHPMTCNYKWEKARENSPHQIFIDLFYNPMIVYRYHAVIIDKRLNIVE